jgi:predicted small secreted protein
MKSLILKLLIGAALAGTLAACNTVAGLGQDMTAAGHNLSNAAEKTRQGL